MDDITFYSAGRSVEYESMEAMIQAENLDIMYPTKFPENVTNVDVRMNSNTNVVEIYTNNPKVGVNIKLNVEFEDIYIYDIYEYNGIEYYIKDENIYLAYSYNGGNGYYITANSYSDLIYIINSMKG